MRIGLFGGTFNPIHMGHLCVTKEVKEGFSLDKIYLIPAAVPPHKLQTHIVDAADRYEMIRLAVSDSQGLSDFVEVSDVELKRKGPSFSIDTISDFVSKLPENTEFYFIVGCDAFLEIDTWKSYEDLLGLVSFIVMSRPDADSLDCPAMWKNIEKYIKYKVSEDYIYSYDKDCFTHVKKKPIYLFKVTPIDISSTMIRRYVGKQKDIHLFVTENVEKYIKKKGLYL